MEKIFEKNNKRNIIMLISFAIVFGVFFNGLFGLNVVNAQEMNNYGLSEETINKIKNGEIKITYDLFGAKGDGKTNDIEAIRKAHDFANELYVRTGKMYTVYAPKKAYYIGSAGENGEIDIATNVHWQNSSFIVDDYIDANKDGINDVDATKNLFRIVSPLKIFGKLNNRNMYYLNYTEEVLDELSSSKAINSQTISLKALVDAFYDGKITVSTSNFYKNNKEKLEKYFSGSQRWAIYVTDSTKRYKRNGGSGAQVNGVEQAEMIIIDGKTGEVLSDINWSYDDIQTIRVFPIPDTQITIKGGNFTTYTNNFIYTKNSSGKLERTYYNRNINVYYTGNVKISNIYHYLNENEHLNTTQCVPTANQYQGFLKISNSAFVNANNIYLSAHTYGYLLDSNGKKTSSPVGTYDLSLSHAINIFLDNINYSNDIYKEDGTINYSACYEKNMISDTRWGIMGTNDTKNIFITNSRLNRIDAHRSVTNLYVEDTTLGSKGLTLTGAGYGYFYGKNLKIDRAEKFLTLRKDYGSIWHGIMVLENINYVIDKEETNPIIIYSDNDQNWDFGYTAYFPQLYINGLTIDTVTRGAKNVDYVTFVRLSNLSNSKKKYLYKFKGDIYLNNLTTSGTTVKLFDNSFMSNSRITLNKSSYGGDNVVNIYLDSDVVVDSVFNSSSNTKFKLVTTMEPQITRVQRFFENLKEISEMPKALKPVIKNITLSQGKINEEINSSITEYTATVDAEKVIVDLIPEYMDSSVSFETKVIRLKEGENIVEFSVKKADGQETEYTLTITRPVSVDEENTVNDNPDNIHDDNINNDNPSSDNTDNSYTNNDNNTDREDNNNGSNGGGGNGDNKEETSEENNPWTNISEWAIEELEKANKYKLIPKILDEKDFTQKITRAEFAATAVKMYEKISGKKTTAEKENPFLDTSDKEILKAYKLGITNGTSETTFSPERLITREQMATMMTRALKKAGKSVSVNMKKAELFADHEVLSSWALESVYFMSGKEIINGVGENRFNPKGDATIEQALVISVRTVSKYKK